LVVNWDAAMGMQVYLDPESVFSNWGQSAFSVFGKKIKSIGLPGKYGSGNRKV
jgi:hypothetical protein